MSVLGLIDRSQIDAGPGGIAEPSTTLGDVFSASIDATARNYLTTSKVFFEGIETVDRDRKYRDLTGRSIYDDAFQNAPNRDELIQLKTTGARPDLVKKAVDDYLAAAKTQDPDRYAAVMNTAEISEATKTKAKEALARQEKTSAGATRASAITGQLAGGAVASFADPLNLATIPLGAGMASGIMKTALIEAGINAGAEIASYPFVAKWQKELDQEYGPSELAENMGMAALFGGVFGGGAKALQVGLEKMTLPNSTKLAEMRAHVEDAPELNQALRHEERRLHIQEADPARYNPDVPPEVQARALQEVDSAINEGRPLNVSKLELTDREILGMDPEKMDDGLKPLHAQMAEELPEVAPTRRAGDKNEIADLSEPAPPVLERQQELTEMYESPEFKSQENANFESQFGEEAEIDSKERVFGDVEGEDTSIQGLRERFKNEREYLSAISSCGMKKS